MGEKLSTRTSATRPSSLRTWANAAPSRGGPGSAQSRAVVLDLDLASVARDELAEGGGPVVLLLEGGQHAQDLVLHRAERVPLAVGVLGVEPAQGLGDEGEGTAELPWG